MKESVVMQEELTVRKCSGGNCPKGQAEKGGKNCSIIGLIES